MQEHSIEVQVPFLQYLFGELPILPILIGSASVETVLRLGQALAELAKEQDLLIVASTDFSHYVTQDTAHRLDETALEAISSLQPMKLIDTVWGKDISMCGVLPVAALLEAAQTLGARSASILHYHTSGDVTGDREAVVGYGAAAIYR
jgi:AmmeMemoRadiSam system protein B